ncbi:hypothetical protein [Natrinema sp. DC36]|uniref:hypothetical protein n=1 Tax=Natrinema sp. DC36 TaxID=2878680 RepID=UPI001CF0125D|nr:hypothetical protein [Natrinema sp. DC36]
MFETPIPTDNWTMLFDEPHGPTNDGWVAGYECIHGGSRAEMTVYWDGPQTDTVEITVDEYDKADDKGEPDRRPVDMTVPKDDVQQKVDEIGKSWINTIDNN